MIGYTDLTKTSRNSLHRIARHDEQQFSKDSIVNVMEKFVKTVKFMDDTILVPCRLMDRQIGDSTDIIPATGKDTTANQLTKSSSAEGKRGAAHSKNVHEFLSASELFNLYNMLNALKNDLLWTTNQTDAEEEQERVVESKTESSTNSSSSSSNSVGVNKGHVRRTSTASMMSTTSVSNLSDSDSDISNENDSGLESDGSKSDNAQSSDGSDIVDLGCQKSKSISGDKATELAKRCKRHLNGLYQCLEQMTEAANYLTARYQSDIGPV
ncbi:CG2765 [Drosophila busckii]|uniref:CG2765 n=1 Tax=Drosophila busckii TaxID=30019 RepID=A0A0M4E6Z1_DROBS|nr:suppressor protein SRP40 [Drosophila busckii]ALC42366.1 CG2765 [Drosophila busckii]